MTRTTPATTSPEAARMHPLPLGAPFGASKGKPVLIARSGTNAETAAKRRTCIWEFDANLHCSIIGTCLSTRELRKVMTKFGLTTNDATDHELHGTAVRLAAGHNPASKLLNKALDQHHKLAIKKFAKVTAEQDVRALWRESVARGEIPGAYWAALTHPAATENLIREAFGEVHMLSHLVGAANRADIHRLCELEQERGALEAKLERQQAQLRDAVVTREEQIRKLQKALATRIASEEAAMAISLEDASLRQLVAALERRLNAEIRRRSRAEQLLADLQQQFERTRKERAKSERELADCREELDKLEAGLRLSGDATDRKVQPAIRLDGLSLLYVGGRPSQIALLRSLGESLGAGLLHHDGGVEDTLDLLPGLTSRADLVLFPVDCISHAAALTVKWSCRQGGKQFIPLRSSGATSFLAALCRPEIAGLVSVRPRPVSARPAQAAHRV